MLLDLEIGSPKVKYVDVVRNERGMALAVAMFALVIVGALVAGALFAGTQEQRVGDSSRRLQQSFGVAELGLYDVVRTWDPTIYNQRGVYPTDSVALPNALLTGATPRHTGSYGGYVYRLNNNLYLIDVVGHDTASGTGSVGAGRARQRMGALARIKMLNLNVQASLTTGSSDALSGNATVNGTDQIPPGWNACGALGPSLAGIRADAGTHVDTSGNASVIGTPPVMIDASVSDSTFSKFGDVTYATLASRANLTFPGQNFSNTIGPVVANGQCNKSALTNWGDGANPTAPCGNYFPIIHITGDATINGDQGQGILLVDGDLEVQGSFQWFGVTIVQGTLKTSGGGNTDAHFWGATMVHDSVTFGTNQLSGHANINYSSCAVMQALNSTGVVALMRSRGFVQLF
jgi:hypothetical protein